MEKMKGFKKNKYSTVTKTAKPSSSNDQLGENANEYMSDQYDNTDKNGKKGK